MFNRARLPAPHSTSVEPRTRLNTDALFMIWFFRRIYVSGRVSDQGSDCDLLSVYKIDKSFSAEFFQR